MLVILLETGNQKILYQTDMFRVYGSYVCDREYVLSFGTQVGRYSERQIS